MIDQQYIVPTITIVEEATFVSAKQLVFMFQMFLHRFRALWISHQWIFFGLKNPKNPVDDVPVRGNAFWKQKFWILMKFSCNMYSCEKSCMEHAQQLSIIDHKLTLEDKCPRKNYCFFSRDFKATWFQWKTIGRKKYVYRALTSAFVVCSWIF